MKNKRGFSLIEVIIATSIVSITMFGVYKLISENTKLVEKSNHTLTVTNLFSVLENCIEAKSEELKDENEELFLNLGNNLTGCIFQKGEIENKIDKNFFTLSIRKKSENTAKTITFWETRIYSDYSGTKTETYVQKK